MQKNSSDDTRQLSEGAGITLAGYQMLRLQPRHWRRLFAFLFGPASRLHGLRNTATQTWRRAIWNLDCADQVSRGNACHE